MRRVLVVDDERDAVEVLEWQLTDSGAQVKTATDGEQAIEIGKRFRPDVLVTDYCLRGAVMGPEVIRVLREALPSLKVVLMTGLPPENLEGELSALDGVTIVRKPFRWADLEHALAPSRTKSGVMKIAPAQKARRRAE